MLIATNFSLTTQGSLCFDSSPCSASDLFSNSPHASLLAGAAAVCTNAMIDSLHALGGLQVADIHANRFPSLSFISLFSISIFSLLFFNFISFSSLSSPSLPHLSFDLSPRAVSFITCWVKTLHLRFFSPSFGSTLTDPSSMHCWGCWAGLSRTCRPYSSRWSA